MEVVPAGFINLWLKKEYCQNIVTQQIVRGILPPPLDKKLRVLIDFSSPNIAKQMHVGHLRWVEKIKFVFYCIVYGFFKLFIVNLHY